MKLLLDENIDYRVALALRKKGEDVLAITETPLTNRRCPDSVILEYARQQERGLVSYDKSDFIRLSRQWAHEGKEHFGIVLIDRATVEQADLKGQIRALLSFLRRHTNARALMSTCVFLTRA